MTWEIRHGDALGTLRALPDGLARCVVTSPPFWGLRDYGCAGQVGLEATPAEYVERLVRVFREVRRVLADDGTLWLNLGDSYATGAGRVGDCPGGGEQGERWKSYGPARPKVPDRKNLDAAVPTSQPNRMPQAGLKPKDLVGIPWRVAFALQADGWWLRADIVWAKPNPMPESVRDRPTRSHEYLFLLAKSHKYYYDAVRIAEPISEAMVRKPWLMEFSDERPDVGGPFRSNGRRGARRKSGNKRRTPGQERVPGATHVGRGFPWEGEVGETLRNRRTVWTIATEPFSEAHFATFPQALIEPCVLAGSGPGDVVLDPFCGSGTVGVVALRHGRRFVGIDLNQSYCEMARRRIAGPLFAEVGG